MSIEEIKSKIDNLRKELDEHNKRTNSEIAKLNNQLKKCNLNDLVGRCFTQHGISYYCVINSQTFSNFISADTICVNDTVINCNCRITLNLYLDGITFISKDEFLKQYNKIQSQLRANLANII